jgi:hypothetical protein
VQAREGDLVLATHGRGIWIVDDLSPLRNLSSDVLAKDAAFLAGRPVQQRMPAGGGWVEGDATFVGRNPAGGAVITYYQRTRHLFGAIKLEVFDSTGKLVDTLPAGKRRGINRVIWTMQVKPPRVPRAAAVAFAASQGPRVPPGTYTVRLTKAGQSIETKLEVGLDRRAPYSVGDRNAQFEAVMKAHALFGEMSALVDKIDAARAAAVARQKALPESDPGRAGAQATIDKLDAIKKEIVATKEGGAITGEERLREHLDSVYGALNGWEGRPAQYQIERVETLRRELGEVAKEFDAVASSEPGPAKAGSAGSPR